jgi:hypothetical protein
VVHLYKACGKEAAFLLQRKELNMEPGDATMYMIFKLAELGVNGGLGAIKATGKGSTVALSAIASLGSKAGKILFYDQHIGRQLKHGEIDSTIFYLPPDAVKSFKEQAKEFGVACYYVKNATAEQSDVDWITGEKIKVDESPQMIFARPTDAEKIQEILKSAPICHILAEKIIPFNTKEFTLDDLKTPDIYEVEEQAPPVQEVEISETEREVPLEKEEEVIDVDKSQAYVEKEDSEPYITRKEVTIPGEEKTPETVKAENEKGASEQVLPELTAFYTRADIVDHGEFLGEMSSPDMPGIKEGNVSPKSSQAKEYSNHSDSYKERDCEIDLSRGVIDAYKQCERRIMKQEGKSDPVKTMER